MQQRIITIAGKTYKSFPSDGHCTGCVALHSRCTTDSDMCAALNNGACNEDHIFKEVSDAPESKPKITPSISLSFDLDLSGCSLPEVFKVKSLRLSHLDDALAKGSDAFTLSTKDATQEVIEVIAEALKQEFLLRFSKV